MSDFKLKDSNRTFSTPREQALYVIMEEGGSVVVDTDEGPFQFTKANVKDLPPLEVFVKGNPKAEADALVQLRNEKAELEKRLAALSSQTEQTEQTEQTKEVAPLVITEPVKDEVVETKSKTK